VEEGLVVPDPSPGLSRNQRDISRWARPLYSLSDRKGSLLNLLHPDVTRHFVSYIVQSVGRSKYCSVSYCFRVWNVRIWVKLRIFMITGIGESNWIEVVWYVWGMASVSRVRWFHKRMWKLCYRVGREWTEWRPASWATICSYYWRASYVDGIESFLRREQSFRYSRISQQFMEPDASLPCWSLFRGSYIQSISSHHIPLRSVLILSCHIDPHRSSDVFRSGFHTHTLYAFFLSLILLITPPWLGHSNYI
jgi:hypothetical protein